MYQSDLKDDEWLKIKNDFNPSDKRGRKSKHDKKAIVDAILYVVKSGCQWRMMPKDFPRGFMTISAAGIKQGYGNAP
ncbi:transposase [Candidatus Williamhamiltonella defendens]|uniref:transposase n=1 Tax=Candidatus Williamhamiltonella defendens TaxID=138072 RepID=UPI001F29E6A2|nr:transposase [Candidatus Hamiltonella defensa]